MAAYDEQELIRQAQAGDALAMQKIVNAHKRQIHDASWMIYRAFTYNAIEQADLIQEGFIGLMEAVKRFDFSYSVSLETFASYYIKQYMVKYLRAHGRTMHIPEYAVAAAKNARRFETQWMQEGYDFTPADIAKEVCLSADELKLIQARMEVRYEAPPWELENEHPMLADDSDIASRVDDGIYRDELSQELLSMVDKLSAKEKRVIKRHYGLGGYKPASLAHIASQWRVDPAVISRLHTRAKTKLAEMVREEEHNNDNDSTG